ncbi:hypothetical protein Hanom_Chr09g00843811 [Helianthus anomalus]
MERMLMHTELTVMAGDHESYNISAQVAKHTHQSRNILIYLTLIVDDQYPKCLLFITELIL